MNKILIAALTAAAAATASAEAPLWLRDIKISPDGTHIAFTYKGDIYTVPTAGGRALRLTSQPTYETSPIWSPDSRTIAFASDRNGNFDIFTVAADGTSPSWKRLTYNSAKETPEAFSPDGTEVLYSAAIQDPATSALFPTGRMTEVYAVPAGGGAPRQVLATPAVNISWAPDGRSFVYEDVKGFEDNWRKHHTSSVTRDIWRYTPATGEHERLVDRPGEDLSPVDAGDAIYFISERAPQTSLNVYRAPAGDYAAATPVTDLRRHPVRFLSRAADGTLAFGYDGEIYTLAAGASAPRKVDIEIVADYLDEPESLYTTRQGRQAVASPDGKQVAFIYRGDVYVTSVEYSTTKQISNTPEAESDLSWGNDSTLYYVSERDGRYNVYRATSRRGSADGDLSHATLIDETRVFDNDGHERTAPRLSPDGKQLAFILDRNILAVKNLENGRVRRLTDGSTYRQRDGGFYYRWSPDSKWIALEIVDRQHDPYTDVAILNVATGELTNITNSGYFDAAPSWTLDGNALIFATERFGMRNHASWGSQMDVMMVFMNDSSLTNYRISAEDRELAGKETVLKRDGDIDVVTDGIADRQVRLTPFSTDLRDAIVSADGETLYFISEADDGCFLWELDLEEGDLDMKKRLSDPLAHFDASADGETIFIFGTKMQKMTPKTETISYEAEKLLDPAAERTFMFDNMVREEAERFYRTDMHGVDWPRLTADYRRFLPHIANNYDFAEMISELLGELNVSHTGARFTGSSETKVDDRTATLGVLYDMTYTGPGQRIAEILPQGPFATVNPSVTAGDIVLAIDGVDIDAEHPVETLLNEKAGKRVLVELRGTDGTSRQVVVKPISRSRQASMLYRRWVRSRAAAVDSLSHGRLGYVHLESMDDESFRRAYSDLLGKYNDREGVVVDIRWNGGGRLHEDIEMLLSGQKYFTQEIRGERTCDMPSRRWNKPSVMLMAEPCYSNAHGTPWVYRHRGLGKLVGMPVPGTMTSVNWVTMQDPSVYYGIPVVGYRLPDGSFLENTQLEPDVRVENTPADIVAGRDAQLEAAVTTLLNEIDSRQ